MINSLKKLLKTEILGKSIHFYDEVGSTNDIAFELARQGSPEGTVVIADCQTEGRGRLQRKWISPRGINLYISVIFRPLVKSSDGQLFTLIASIALSETINALGLESKIKWPNDLLIKGKKVAGILTEMQSMEDMVDFLVVGIGLNLNMSREMMQMEMAVIAEAATSVKELLCRDVDTTEITANLIFNLEKWYQEFNNKGNNYIINEWKKRWGDFGRRVHVDFDDSVVEGVAFDINDKGFLLIKKDDGTIERVISGDVKLV